MAPTHPESIRPDGDSAPNTWIEVDTAALAHNLRAVRAVLKPPAQLMAVVKANAYGHGPEAALALQEAAADRFAVTTLAEAIAIRRAGVTAPILVFCPLFQEQLPAAIEHGLTLTAGCESDARAISKAASRVGASVAIHLKIDTGLGRFGVLPELALPLAQQASGLPGLSVEGIYTHFGTAMSRDLSFAQVQLARFKTVLEQLEAEGMRPLLAHCANSAALLQMPDSHLDMVRVGTLLYGQFPAPFLSHKLSLRSTWRMLSRVAAVKDVPAGWSIGYGAEYRTTRPARIAVVPVGYADGFALEVNARSRSTPAERARAVAKTLRGTPARSVRIAGKLAPVLGRVSMQLITVDVSDIPEAAVGLAVEVPCRRVNSNPLLPRIMRPSSDDAVEPNAGSSA